VVLAVAVVAVPVAVVAAVVVGALADRAAAVAAVVVAHHAAVAAVVAVEHRVMMACVQKPMAHPAQHQTIVGAVVGALVAAGDQGVVGGRAVVSQAVPACQAAGRAGREW
jgi:hypothetical protein